MRRKRVWLRTSGGADSGRAASNGSVGDGSSCCCRDLGDVSGIYVGHWCGDWRLGGLLRCCELG